MMIGKKKPMFGTQPFFAPEGMAQPFGNQPPADLPFTTPPQGSPMFNPHEPDTAFSLPGIAPPQSATAAAKPKINWMGVLADALSGAAGQPGQYAAGLRQERKEQSAYERGEQQYQRRRMDSREDDDRNAQQQREFYDYKLANPGDPFISVPMANGVFNGPRSQFYAQYGGGGGGQPSAPPSGPAAWADGPQSPQGGQAAPPPATFPGLDPRRPYYPR